MKQTVYPVIKRGLDAILSLLAILILSPLLLGLMLAVKLDSPGPVFFTQRRIGQGTAEFRMFKFRTMRTDTPHDMPTHLLKNADSYITKVGAILRKTSLDELPQLFNILAGQMSFVGPRPALYNQADLIAEREKVHANDVRPGLTGWAQINGRDELEIPVKAALDGEYVRQMSLLFDLKCLFGTVLVVLRHDGVVEGGTGKLREKKE